MRKLKISILLAAALLAAGAARAQSAPAREAAFKGGERLVYRITYNLAALLNEDVGEVVMRATNTRIGNTAAYKIHANARTTTTYKTFFELDDTYESWLDMGTLRPMRFASRLREDAYRFRADYIYDWNDRLVYTTSRNLRRPEDKHATLRLGDHSFDAIALFYNLRSEDISRFTPGAVRTMEVVLDDTVRRVNYRFLGREERNIRGMGRFRTLKFSCQLATSSGQSFQDGSEFFLWISDDRNRIPLYIESPIRVGSITGRIVMYENLKYPLDSKIR